MADMNVFGTTGSVLSVMDLVKKPLHTIPEKYIRPELKPSRLSDKSNSSPIPIVDLNCLVSDGKPKDIELEKLHSICKEWGFFQVINHGVSPQLLEKLKLQIEKFFHLPNEEKMKYKIRPGDVQGYGTIIRGEDQKLDWGDRCYMVINPIHRRKPYLLPEFPPSFRDTLESYISEVRKLAMTLLELLAKAIGMELKEMKDIFEDGMQSIRMTCYHPCPQPELVLGLTEHSDASGITILNQVNGIEGLEIEKDGAWIPVTFHPDAFVVNVGDIMEITSNGAYSSVEHRAVVNKEKERISVAMFFNPKFEAEIGPVKSMLSPKTPPMFKRILMEDYFKEFFSSNLNGKSYLEKMKIQSGEEHV